MTNFPKHIFPVFPVWCTMCLGTVSKNSVKKEIYNPLSLENALKITILPRQQINKHRLQEKCVFKRYCGSCF